MSSLAAALSDDALHNRLGTLLADERNVVADFLIHLEELDRRRLYERLGFASLFDYCVGRLRLLKGAAYRRITAARLVRRFPGIEDYLRDGRLCLTTVALLKDVLEAENVGRVLDAASHKSKEEVEMMVAYLRPRRAMPDLVKPLSPELYRLSLTVSAEFMEELEEVRAALSHKYPRGELELVVRESFRLVLERYRSKRGMGKRAIQKPPGPEEQEVSSKPEAKEAGSLPTAQEKGMDGERAGPKRAPSGREHIPHGVQRVVWQRDRGVCTYPKPDGTKCGSPFQVEVDHIVPLALGGSNSYENLRLLCRAQPRP
jgi:hypothetical protein